MDGDCSHEFKRYLLFWRRGLKSRNITLLIKVLSSESYGFSSSRVCMWKLGHKESWAPKNWCFWTLVLEKTLESPWDYKEIKPVNRKVNPKYSLQGLLRKLQYFGHLMQRTDSLEKTLMLGKIEGRRRRGQQKRRRWLDGIADSMNMSLSKLREIVKAREGWRAAVRGVQRFRHDWVTE